MYVHVYVCVVYVCAYMSMWCVCECTQVCMYMHVCVWYVYVCGTCVHVWCVYVYGGYICVFVLLCFLFLF